MNPLDALASMIFRNPFTSIPGALLVLTSGGKVLEDLGLVLQHLGSGDNLLAVIQSPELARVITGFGLIFSKDWNVTGGSRPA